MLSITESDARLCHYYLSILRNNLECARLGYMKRYEDSEGVLSNEKAKAEYVACDIRTIDAWLERHEDCAVDHNKVTHLNPDYSTKDIIEF